MLAADPGLVEVSLEKVDLVEEMAEGFDLSGQLGLVGGGVEGVLVPGLAEAVAEIGVGQVFCDSGGDAQEGLGAAGGWAFETETFDFGVCVLAFDRETELGHVVRQLA